ncbi:Lactate utilization protein C [Roseobacter fucihabitans]|uniref:Lactate utilization protein C n=1 Tax=Roseobacter fucihabitans TaxID=1537242 RepID=A0ABZ2BW70_9RHOB|nr:LUD domain-containing protein [Roseobacter litoralis]MBC6967358.1 Lactate utilization protein C [Roseobacter litoralis]
MSDRALIFGAIRSAKRSPARPAEDIAKEAADLVAHPEVTQPGFAGETLLDRFVAKATSERVTATVDQLAAKRDIPRAVSEYLKKIGQGTDICVQNCAVLNGLDWSGFACSPDLEKDRGCAVTLAEYGIAETGSVVFRSGADSPILLNFLPMYHIVVLRTDTLIGYTEDLWPLLGGAHAPQSRLLTIVTGTSGTADIEAINVRGAHGPKHMHILIVPP